MAEYEKHLKALNFDLSTEKLKAHYPGKDCRKAYKKSFSKKTALNIVNGLGIVQMKKCQQLN